MAKYHATLKQNSRKRTVLSWDFFANSAIEAEEYIKTRDGFREAKILSLEAVEMFPCEVI